MKFLSRSELAAVDARINRLCEQAWRRGWDAAMTVARAERDVELDHARQLIRALGET